MGGPKTYSTPAPDEKEEEVAVDVPADEKAGDTVTPNPAPTDAEGTE